MPPRRVARPPLAPLPSLSNRTRMAPAHHTLVFYAGLDDKVRQKTFNDTLRGLANLRPQATKLDWHEDNGVKDPDSDEYEAMWDNCWSLMEDEVVCLYASYEGPLADAEADREQFLAALAEKGIKNTEVNSQIMVWAAPREPNVCSERKRKLEAGAGGDEDAKKAKNE